MKISDDDRGKEATETGPPLASFCLTRNEGRGRTDREGGGQVPLFLFCFRHTAGRGGRLENCDRRGGGAGWKMMTEWGLSRP